MVHLHMEFLISDKSLKRSLICALFFYATVQNEISWASVPPDSNSTRSAEYSPTDTPAELDCPSTYEYSKALRFLRRNSTFIVPEKGARKIAFEVSKGCKGASKRFAEVLVLLQRLGFSEKGALREALEFSKLSDEIQTNFFEIFQTVYLSEFFDFDPTTSYRIALEFSKNFRGSATQLRADFEALAKFCSDQKKLQLPTRTCAQFTVEMARLSPRFPNGVRGDFEMLFDLLTKRDNFKVSVKEALMVCLKVLSYGSQAPANFKEAF